MWRTTERTGGQSKLSAQLNRRKTSYLNAIVLTLINMSSLSENYIENENTILLITITIAISGARRNTFWWTIELISFFCCCCQYCDYCDYWYSWQQYRMPSSLCLIVAFFERCRNSNKNNNCFLRCFPFDDAVLSSRA